jgi:hypothetical protein
LFIWGPPGIGKSDLVRQAAAALKLQLIDVRAVLLDPVDLRGIPAVNGDHRAHWCLPDFLPRDGKGILFLDELAQAPPLVQSACLQLTLDRRIGEYELPEGWIVIAASNRQEDRAGAHRLITPLLNRFIHLDLEVSVDDWQSWALANGVLPEVRSFIAYRPGLLHLFKPESNERAFATPRSWASTSQILPQLSEDLTLPVISGTVGAGPAAEFVSYLKLFREIPDPNEVLDKPETAQVPTGPAVLYALTGALVELIRTKAPDKLLKALVTYAMRLPAEFAVLLMRDSVAVAPRILTLPEAATWLRTNRHLLFSGGKK